MRPSACSSSSRTFTNARSGSSSAIARAASSGLTASALTSWPKASSTRRSSARAARSSFAARTRSGSTALAIPSAVSPVVVLSMPSQAAPVLTRSLNTGTPPRGRPSAGTGSAPGRPRTGSAYVCPAQGGQYPRPPAPNNFLDLRISRTRGVRHEGCGYATRMPDLPAAILDVDGTLVDTVYHHALAWHRALRRSELDVPVWRVHRHIGMGGDQMVAALCGQEVERDRGDAIREAESEEYDELIGEVRALPGARELVEELKRRGHAVVLASSAKAGELDHYLDLLAVRELADAWTSSADVEATKPNPDLVQQALERVPEGSAVMVGDSVWDCEAAG